MENTAYLKTMFGLEGKVAIVTGSTGGLGRAFAEALFQAGAFVVVNGRNDERTAKARDEIYEKFGKSSGLLSVGGDMSVPEDADKLVNETLSAFGQIDIIVNNAGINITENPFEKNSMEEWEQLSKVNLGGPINLIRVALPHLKKSSNGRIINVASIGGHVGLPNNSLYTMTKGGIKLFTQSLAAELALTNVRVNSISPGVFATPMNAKFTASKEVEEEATKGIPMRRMGDPKEMVGAVIYLASAASSYCNGTDIVVDGGYTSV